MIPVVERYLAVRRATGFELNNAEYLLRSFARWAAQRSETHIRAKPQSLGRAKPHQSRNEMRG